MRFPPYAYVPGHRPHPTRHEDGHSYNKIETVPVAIDPQAWRACPPYLEGIALFNAGYYWEAHEVWEGLWIAAGRTGELGEFFQGLIKLSAAGLKIRQQLAARAVALGASAEKHFERTRDLGGRTRIGGLAILDLLEFARYVRAEGERIVGSPEPAVEVVFGRRLDPTEIDASELAAITATTLGHYEERAEAFWEGTRDHDVSQNRAALLRHIDGPPPLTLLDLGCGPGRDLIAFAGLGHTAVGLDGARRFCEMARRNSGCEVLHQDLLSLELPATHFDGVFANATLFHVPTQELPQVLDALWAALVPGGVLFSSNPRGDNEEGWHGDRYGAYHDHARWTAIVTSRGFEELEHYYRPPARPRREQPWLATVYRKIDAR